MKYKSDEMISALMDRHYSKVNRSEMVAEAVMQVQVIEIIREHFTFDDVSTERQNHFIMKKPLSQFDTFLIKEVLK